MIKATYIKKIPAPSFLMDDIEIKVEFSKSIVELDKILGQIDAYVKDAAKWNSSKYKLSLTEELYALLKEYNGSDMLYLYECELTMEVGDEDWLDGLDWKIRYNWEF